MKKIAGIVLLAALMLLLQVGARCADLSEALGVSELENAVPQSAREALGTLDSEDDVQSGLERLFGFAVDKLSEVMEEALRPALATLAVALLCACCTGLNTKSSGLDYVGFGGCLAVSGICFSDIGSVMVVGKKAMDDMLAFSHAMLPTLCISASAAGAAGSSAAKYAAAVMFLDILMSAAANLIFPLISAYAAVMAASACLGSEQLKGAAGMIKSVVRLVLVLLVSAFTIYLSLTSLVASSADVMATKAAKTAISTFVPVVGGIISDAAGSVVAGAGIVRASVGVFGLVAVLAVCLLPFLRLGARYLLFKLSGTLALSCTSDRLSRLIEGAADVYGLILASVGAEAVFLYISVISMAKAVGG